MQSHHFIANTREKSGNSDRFSFLGLQHHCSQWLQPWNYKTHASWKESYDKPREHIQKQRHHFANKSPHKVMVFPVVMYGCESWTMKKAKCQTIDTFELWCWRRLSRVPWKARRSNQSVLKEISPESSLEGLKPKLKLQYFGHLMWKAYSLEKTWCWERLTKGREGGDRAWDGWTALSTQWTWVWANSRR